MATFADQAGFEQAHFEAIGRMAVEWSYLESIVELGIWGFGNLEPKVGRNFTADLFITPRLQLLTHLGHSKLGPSGRRRLDAAIAKIRAVQADRNDIIHATWDRSGRPNQVIRVRYKHQRKPNQGSDPEKRRKFVARVITEVSPEDIAAVATEISKASKRLRKFLAAVGAVPPP